MVFLASNCICKYIKRNKFLLIIVETFWEISQLKEEVRDLKTLVTALISKLKDGSNNVSNDVTLDSYLHKSSVELANNAIDNLEEVEDDGGGDEHEKSKNITKK